MEGTFKQADGACANCGENMEYDEIEKKCVCKPNTFETETMECVVCPRKLVYEDGGCECIFNYFLNSSGNCEKCVRDSDGPKCRRIIL